jgi:hypothetical protein
LTVTVVVVRAYRDSMECAAESSGAVADAPLQFGELVRRRAPRVIDSQSAIAPTD